MDRNELKRFYDCMEQFRNVSIQSPAYKPAEEQLSEFLTGLKVPEDMSQIIHCLKGEPEGSRTKIGRSVMCLEALVSWTRVRWVLGCLKEHNSPTPELSIITLFRIQPNESAGACETTK